MADRDPPIATVDPRIVDLLGISVDEILDMPLRELAERALDLGFDVAMSEDGPFTLYLSERG